MNVDLIKSAISTDLKHMESMALNMESLGRNRERYVHHGIKTVHPLKSVQWQVLASRKISCGRPHEVITCLLFPGRMCQKVTKVPEDRGLQRQSHISPRDVSGRGLSSRHTLTAGRWGPAVHLCL